MLIPNKYWPPNWRGDLGIMDNLAAHKVAKVGEAIEKAGAWLLYLPPYSSDLNPIEMACAKLKALLRRTAARTRAALWDGIAERRRGHSPRPNAAI